MLLIKRHVCGFNAVICNACLLSVGTLIKLVYFSREDGCLENSFGNSVRLEEVGLETSSKNYPILDGKLHFKKFQTSKINECLDFIESKLLQGSCMTLSPLPTLVYIFYSP